MYSDPIHFIDGIPHWAKEGGYKYNYPPIPTEQDPKSIRLLKLLPGDGSTPLKCTIIQASLAQSPDYEAISYRWGPPRPDGLIILIRVGDCKVRIGGNLYTALYSLRHASQSRMLWADAICIDQNNDEEKGTQVQMMREIYQRAARTVVWLGNDPDAGTGLKLIHEAAQRQELLGRSRLQDTMSGPLGIPMNDLLMVILLINSLYFERVWIIQEVAVSSNVEVICNVDTASWDDLVSVSKAFSGKASLATPKQHIQNILSIAKARESFGREQYPSLLSLLVSYRSFCATDPRDKVYALLGLLDPKSPEASCVKPDYKANTESVCISVARFLLSKSKNLDLLSCSSSSSPQLTSGELKLPSWVPDWTKGTASPFLNLSVRDEADAHVEVVQTFFATRDSKSTISSESSTELESSPLSICLRGHVVDKVDVVGIVAPPSPPFFDMSSPNIVRHMASTLLKTIQYRCDLFWTLIKWEKITGAHGRTRKPYLSPDGKGGENMLDVYWKTFSAYILREDADDWAKAKAEMELNTAQFRLLWYLQLHHSYITFTVLIWVSLPILGILMGLGLVPVFNPFKTDYYIGRRMFRTQDGYVGLGPQYLQSGDQVALFEGGKLPFIIRGNGSEQYELIGDCIVHGAMSGELYDPKKCSKFWIV